MSEKMPRGVRHDYGKADREYGMRMFAVRKAGTWRTDDKGLCVRVENDPWICGRFYRLGSGRFYFDVPQHGQDYNTLTIRD